MPLSVHDRIPGVVVRDLAPRAEVRPRLDVAGFVGFTERGPVNRPRPLDDLAAYERVFGRLDAELEAGEQWLRPFVPQAVRAFFENGGRRCWVVRVSGDRAGTAEWVLPQILREDLLETRVRASSPGSWANAFRLELRLRPSTLSLRGPTWDAADKSFRLTAPDEWEVGDVLRLVELPPLAPDRFFHVDAIVPERDDPRAWRARGRLTGSPTPFSGALRLIERLRFDLHVRGPVRERGTTRELELLEDLAFAPGNTRYWLDVIARDSVYLAPPEPLPVELFEGGVANKPVTYPRLAPPGAEELGAEVLEGYLNPPGLPSSIVESNGAGSEDFADFTPELFVPRELEHMGAQQLEDLAAEAQEEMHRAELMHRGARRTYMKAPRGLTGILALLPIDEIGLLAVPDAVQLAGKQRPADDLTVAPPPPSPAPKPPRGPECCSPEGDLATCVPPPVSAPPPSPPAPDPPTPLNAKPRRIVYGFTLDAALAIQQGAVRFCSLRRDAVAVLATPRRAAASALNDLDDVDEIDWRRRLENPEYDMSYAALYAPWTLVAAPSERDARELRATPPDGVACGAIAKRELARGVWIAPANEPLRGILGLDQSIDAPRWADVLDAGINLVRPIPGDFRIMSARTLSLELAYSQLSVRRLMIYLRKLLIWWGREYVFESNTPQLRSALQRRLERELYRLFRRGAFAGERPAESYQVVVDEPVNTPASVDLGQLIVLVKVAPSWPMEWLEVRLVRTGEGPLQILEG